MTLKYEYQEFSVGRYVYVVYRTDLNISVCYVWAITPRAKEFVEWFCHNPHMIKDVMSFLSEGKEIKSTTIEKLLYKDNTYDNDVKA